MFGEEVLSLNGTFQLVSLKRVQLKHYANYERCLTHQRTLLCSNETHTDTHILCKNDGSERDATAFEVIPSLTSQPPPPPYSVRIREPSLDSYGSSWMSFYSATHKPLCYLRVVYNVARERSKKPSKIQGFA